MGKLLQAMPFSFPKSWDERVPGVGDEDYDHSNPLMRAQATEQRTRDYFVAVEVAKLAREKLRMCYRKETVNHTQACEKLVKDYLKKSNDVVQLQFNQFKPAPEDD